MNVAIERSVDMLAYDLHRMWWRVWFTRHSKKKLVVEFERFEATNLNGATYNNDIYSLAYRHVKLM